jgi:maleylpyruvate isomerase
MSILFTFFRSSASFRVRIALNLKQIPYQPEIISLPNGEQVGGTFLAQNPQGLVPLYVDANGSFSQSLAIMEYLDEALPSAHRLLPSDAVGRARVRSLSMLIACEIHPLNNLRVLKYLKHELKQDEEGVNNWYRHWVAEGLQTLERQLIHDKHQSAYLHGETPTMADCCLVPQIFNAKRYECDLTTYPKLMKVFENCMKLHAFDQAQPNKQPDAA